MSFILCLVFSGTCWVLAFARFSKFIAIFVQEHTKFAENIHRQTFVANSTSRALSERCRDQTLETDAKGALTLWNSFCNCLRCNQPFETIVDTDVGRCDAQRHPGLPPPVSLASLNVPPSPSSASFSSSDTNEKSQPPQANKRTKVRADCRCVVCDSRYKIRLLCGAILQQKHGLIVQSTNSCSPTLPVSQSLPPSACSTHRSSAASAATVATSA